MGHNEFLDICIDYLVNYVNAHLDATDGVRINADNVYVVWWCKTLQNSKALLSTTLADGMYYEITYNGDKNEFYFDAYKKFENRCFRAPAKEV